MTWSTFLRKMSNGLLHLRIIEKLRSSHDPLSVVKALNQNGTSMKDLNNYPEIGTLLCDIVRRNYGLGIKILFDCGLDLSSEDLTTGDTPLLLVCSEGLCGSTKQLINCLPRTALLHANQLGATALKHLLTRAHASCGCLETLLARFRPCIKLLPVKHCTSSTESEQIPEHTQHEGQIVVPNVSYEPNTILFTVEALLNRIRSTDPQRIFSVFHIWIKYNLFFIQELTPETVQQQHQNVLSLCQRLVEPVMKRLESNTPPPEVNKMYDQLIHLITQLIILGQINARTAWTELEKYVSNAFDTDSVPIEFSDAAQHLGYPLPLQAIAVYRLRQLLQQQFIRFCHNPHGPECETIDALVFHDWVRSLPIPHFLQVFLLLDSTDFHLHH